MIDRNSQCKDTRKVASKIVQGQGGVIPSAAAVGVEPAHDFSVEFKDVSFSYRSRPTVRVLNDLSVKIADKRITCFVGESGSGKSTFAALLCGLYRPLTGHIHSTHTCIHRTYIKYTHPIHIVVTYYHVGLINSLILCIFSQDLSGSAAVCWLAQRVTR